MKHSQKSHKEYERKHRKANKIKRSIIDNILPYDRKTGKIKRSC